MCLERPEEFYLRELPLFIIGFALMLLLGICYQRVLSTKVILCIAFLVLNIAMITILFTFNTVPVSDYKILWDMSQKMANGEFAIANYSHTSYEYIYNWQLGIVFCESLLIKLFGPHFIILKWVSLIVINLTAISTYALAKTITSKNIAVVSYVLFCFFYPIFGSCGQFSNSHLATLLLVISFFLIYKKKYYCVAMAGAIAGAMTIIRPIGIILLIAIACHEIFFSLSTGKLKKPAARLVLFLSFYFFVTSLANHFFIHMGYADGPVTTAKIPYFKFHKGLTGYDNLDFNVANNDLEKFNEWEKREVISSIRNQPIDVAKFVVRKMGAFYGIYDAKFKMTYNKNPEIWQQYPIKALYSIGWGQYFFLLIMAFFGIKAYNRKNGADICIFFFLGYMTVYFFIEAFSAYRYEAYPLLIIFAAQGIIGIYGKHRVTDELLTRINALKQELQEEQ